MSDWVVAACCVLVVVGLVVVVTGVVVLTRPADPQPEWVAVKSQKRPEPITGPAVVVFVGDSYTRGAGVTDEDKRWTSIVTRDRGWTEVNLGRGGTGYVLSADDPANARRACGLDNCPSYTKMIAAVVAANPDIIVVSGGRNEVRRAADGKWSTSIDARWALGVGAFFADLRAAAPRARIVATSPIWDDDPAPEAIQAMRSVVERAVTLNGGVYVNLGDPLLGRRDYVTNDGIHPSEAGHAAIASAFAAAYPAKPSVSAGPAKSS